MDFLKVYKKVAFLSFQLIIHYIHVIQYCNVYSIQFKVKTFKSMHYHYIELEIPLSGDVKDNAHKVFFDFFEKYTQTT